MPAALRKRTQAPSSTSAVVRRGTPLYEQIYDSLWTLIFKGEISPGQRLSDRDWAQRLNTSRTPVREAMRQMARDGVLIVLENGGYQVRAADAEGLAHLYKCRAPLAALAAEETTRLATERLVKQIRSVVENTRKAIADRDSAAVLKLNSKFYDLLVANCGNPYLVLITRNLEKLILFYRIALMKRSAGQGGEYTQEYYEHLARGNERQLQIVDAMTNSDAERARSLMLRHLLTSSEDMARLLQPTRS